MAARKAELEAEPRFSNREGVSFGVGDAVYVQRSDGTWLHARVTGWFVDACDEDSVAVFPRCLRAHDYVTVDSSSPEHFGPGEKRTVRADVVHVGKRPSTTVLAVTREQSALYASSWEEV